MIPIGWPGSSGKPHHGTSDSEVTHIRNLFFRVLILALAGGAVTNAQTREPSGPWQNYDTSNGEWRSYAGDIKGTKTRR